ncbi:MAG: hypothetical protein E7418_04345 [Ruminococcaceae bacterium]|nr:hypothetical protein [Oscillospiraceae bacterium]
MKKRVLSLVICICLLCGFITPVSAMLFVEDGEVTDYIIELTGLPLYATEGEKEAEENLFLPFSFFSNQNRGDSKEAIIEEQNAVLKSIYQTSGAQAYATDEEVLEPDARYTNVFNGFSMKLTAAQAAHVAQLDGVKNVVCSRVFALPRLAGSTEMIGVNKVPVTDYDGTGEVIAVLDTGFDTDHPFYALDHEDKLAISQADVASMTESLGFHAEQAYVNKKIPFAYDYADRDYTVEGNDHGTHVAGIAAGNSPDFNGVAPEAQLILMKVFGDSGAAEADILAALDDLVLFKKVSVANLSLGLDYMSADPDRVGGTLAYQDVFSRLGEAGILVNCAAGNAGRGKDEVNAIAGQADYGSQGIPAYYAEAFSVGAVINTSQSLPAFALADGTKIAYMAKDAQFEASFSGAYYEYMYVGYGTPEEIPESVAGKIAVIDRGSVDATTGNPMTFVQKERNAYAKGAVGIVFINNNNEYVIASTDGLLPSCMIAHADANAIKNQADKKLTGHGGIELFPVTGAGKMADFSAWGVDYNLNLKPEISAPGQFIYSSVDGGAYGTKSGTSMATPHISGATALLNSYLSESFPAVRGTDKTLLMQKLMMSTATPVYASEGVLASPRHQGAGALNLLAAMQTNAVLSGSDGKSKISLGDDIEDTFTLSFLVENITDEDVSYDEMELFVMADDSVLRDGVYYVNGMQNLTASATGFAPVRLAADEAQQLTLQVNLNEEELLRQAEIFTNGFFIDGFVTLRDSRGVETELHIPFTGFRGDWERIPKLDKPIWDEDAVYGETGLFSKVQNAKVTLGRNFSEQNSLPQQKYAAVSPNGDGVMDDLTVNFAPLSAATNIGMGVYYNGDTVAHQNFGFQQKYKGRSITFKQAALSQLPAGTYTVRLSAINDYDGNKDEETLDMPFVIDLEKPRIIRMREYMQGDKKMLDVAAQDNEYVMTVVLSGSGQNIYAHFAPNDKGELCHATFDITNVESYTVGVMDYAGNTMDSNSFPVVSTIEKNGQTGSYTIRFAGNLSESKEVFVIPAVYEKEGRFLCAGTPTKVTIPKQGDEASSCTWSFAQNMPAGVRIKLFYWTDMKHITPAFKMPVTEQLLK